MEPALIITADSVRGPRQMLGPLLCNINFGLVILPLVYHSKNMLIKRVFPARAQLKRVCVN